MQKVNLKYEIQNKKEKEQVKLTMYLQCCPLFATFPGRLRAERNVTIKNPYRSVGDGVCGGDPNDPMIRRRFLRFRGETAKKIRGRSPVQRANVSSQKLQIH